MSERYAVFDGHNDLAWAVRELCGYDLEAVDLRGGEPRLQTDLPRLRRGEVAAQFWSVYVPASLPGGAAVTATLEQIDFVRTMVERYADELAPARTAADVRAARAAGRIASLTGIEGGHSIDGSLGVLRMMYELGVRYMTLTHNENLAWADSATDVPVAGGLTDFGRDVVREMNALGMFVDLSHVSADVMRQALDVSSAPVIFSHSSARSVCDIDRNVPDDVLTRLPANGGVCMLAFVPMFVSQPVADWYADCLEITEARGGDRRRFSDVDAVLQERIRTDPPPPCTVDDVADCVDRVREVAGVEQVGLGGDYDGSAFFPSGLEDVGCYPALFDALSSRGWSAADLEALGFGNIVRAMADMESVGR